MTYESFACYFALEAIAVWMLARAYYHRKARIESDAVERIRQKYQSHISRPSQTSKQ